MPEWQIPRENQFTQPRPDCPHPEWWTSENNMATEREVAELVAAFVRACQPEYVLEIGAHYGQTTELIAKAIVQNGHGRFTTLEIDHGLAGTARRRVGTLPAEIVEMDSLQYVPPQPIDLLFVDGNPNRSADVEHYLPYLAPAAIVLIHDMAAYHDQHRTIIEKLCPWNRVMLHTPRGLLILERSAPITAEAQV